MPHRTFRPSKWKKETEPWQAWRKSAWKMPRRRPVDPQARPEELRLLEALLFASAEPIDQAALAKRMPDGVDVKAALAQLQAEYAPRGVNLVRVANKWTFRTAGDLSWLMTRESTETRRAVARGDRGARDHRLSPAGDARRDRGNPRRGHLQGHARRAAGNRLDPSCAAAARRPAVR